MVLPIIFMVLYVLSQILGGREQAKRKAGPRPQRPPRPPQVPGHARPAPQPPNQADALRREVEQFLRRAQGQPEPPARPKPTPQTSSTAPQPPSAAFSLREESVVEHVAEHINSRELKEHAQRLGSQLKQAEDRLESHVHEKFDHQLGRLHHQQTTKAAAAADLADQLVELLSRPEGMRQMILAQEILRRPDQRW